MRLFCLIALICHFVGQSFAADHVTVTSNELIDLNAHFPFSPPSTREAWEARAQQVREQIKVALALHPAMDLPVPQPKIHGKRQMAGYSIEKIYFESLPGLYVTGSLYRPVDNSPGSAKRPAVMYAHGHWDNGRFYEASAAEVKNLLATGAERFESAAINHMQAACVQLARMGCVVLQWDMLGYADAQQLSFDRVHRYGLTDPNFASTTDGWPLYSPKAEMWGQSVMALQTMNGIVAYRMLSGLPDVDPEKVVITGASGGGTQSFITAAVLPNLRGAMPAVMVSTGMQGGCTCENACGLRVGTGNVEIAATIAPRSLSMTAADDWTKTMASDGFPQLQQLFDLYGAKNAVRLHQGVHFPHNYNHVARVALYAWVNQLFDLKGSEPILESDFERLGKADLTVWNESHPRPASGEAFERQLLKEWTELIRQSFDQEEPNSPPGKSLAVGWDVILAPAQQSLSEIRSKATSSDGEILATAVSVKQEVGRITRRSVGSASSSLMIHFADGVHADLIAMDRLGALESRQPLLNQPRPAAAYTFGYNAPQLVRRTGVALSLLDSLKLDSSHKASLVASGDDAFIALATAFERPDLITEIEISQTNLNGYFDEVTSIDSPRFVPHVLRYQGLSGLAKAVQTKGVTVVVKE